jgi:hypothetical protein
VACSFGRDPSAFARWEPGQAKPGGEVPAVGEALRQGRGAVHTNSAANAMGSRPRRCGAWTGAAGGGDDVLTVGTVLAAVLDDLQVAAGPGRLEAEGRGAPGSAPRVAEIRHNKVHAM